MPLITDSEMEDFDAAILGAGFEVNDFHVLDQQDEPTAKEQHTITGTVTVHRISTDEAITYSAWPRWVSMFEIDLHEGKFGQP
jgi:hypothetical protein